MGVVCGVGGGWPSGGGQIQADWEGERGCCRSGLSALVSRAE